jgi:hypothetical protein
MAQRVSGTLSNLNTSSGMSRLARGLVWRARDQSRSAAYDFASPRTFAANNTRRATRIRDRLA